MPIHGGVHTRGEGAGRRNFNLAHELFPLLTWEATPPRQVEEARDFGGNRVERLANTFAAAVLMPTAAVESFGDWRKLDEDGLIARLNAAADELSVTSSALRWRLVALGRLSAARARALPDAALRNNGRPKAEGILPPLFSTPFAKAAAAAVDGGHVSVRKLAKLLGVSIEGLEELFSARGIDCAIDL